jgi:hypothetical protein
MSKYDELCDAVLLNEAETSKYFEESVTFASALIRELTGYLEIPKDRILFVPPQEGSEGVRGLTLPGAMEQNEDSYWHLGVQINLTQDPNSLPQKAIIVRIRFKKDDDKFVVLLENTDGQFTLSAAEKSGIREFCDFVYSQIKDTYEKNLSRCLGKDEAREMGF